MKARFCIGRNNIKSVTENAGAEATRIKCDASAYTVGDIIIIGEYITDRYYYEYLGAITNIAVDDSYIDVTYALSRAYTTDADIWTPTTDLDLGVYLQLPFTNPVEDLGYAIDYLGSGEPYSTQMAIPASEFTWTLSNISSAIFTSLIDWYKNKSVGPANYFWAFENNRNGHRVIWLTNLSQQYQQMNQNNYYDVQMSFYENIKDLA